MAIASATSETTIESPIMFQSGVAVSDDRMAVVHHVSGLHHATIDSHVDEPLIGNTEPDRSHMGMNTRFMTLWKEEAALASPGERQSDGGHRETGHGQREQGQHHTDQSRGQLDEWHGRQEDSCLEESDRASTKRSAERDG